MAKAHPLLLEIASQLRELAGDADTEWSFSIHADEEMIEDHLEYPDAVYVIQHCKIINGEFEDDCWRCVVKGKTTDGIWVRIPVRFSLDERYIEIISGWKIA